MSLLLAFGYGSRCEYSLCMLYVDRYLRPSCSTGDRPTLSVEGARKFSLTTPALIQTPDVQNYRKNSRHLCFPRGHVPYAISHPFVWACPIRYIPHMTSAGATWVENSGNMMPAKPLFHLDIIWHSGMRFFVWRFFAAWFSQPTDCPAEHATCRKHGVPFN